MHATKVYLKFSRQNYFYFLFCLKTSAPTCKCTELLKYNHYLLLTEIWWSKFKWYSDLLTLTTKKQLQKIQIVIFTTMIFSITNLSITTFSITTLSLKGLFVTLSIRDTKHKGIQPSTALYWMPLCYLIMLSVGMLSVTFQFLLCWVPLFKHRYS